MCIHIHMYTPGARGGERERERGPDATVGELCRYGIVGVERVLLVLLGLRMTFCMFVARVYFGALPTGSIVEPQFAGRHAFCFRST